MGPNVPSTVKFSVSLLESLGQYSSCFSAQSMHTKSIIRFVRPARGSWKKWDRVGLYPNPASDPHPKSAAPGPDDGRTPPEISCGVFVRPDQHLRPTSTTGRGSVARLVRRPRAFSPSSQQTQHPGNDACPPIQAISKLQIPLGLGAGWSCHVLEEADKPQNPQVPSRWCPHTVAPGASPAD
jgi:hypothetical protein